MSRPRLSPSFVVAVLALVLASGGVGYAAGQVTSAQIKDGTVQSRDVRDRTLTGRDVRPRSLGRDRLDHRCARGEVAAFGGCVRSKPYGRSTLEFATRFCNNRNGRLPSLFELDWIRRHDEFTFGDPARPDLQYEFSSDNTTEDPSTPIGMYVDGYNLVPNASAQSFHFHCVTS